MSRRDRRKFTATFKTEVVLEALKERRTMSELAQQFDLHPNQIATWKKDFLAAAPTVFESVVDQEREALKQKQDELIFANGYQTYPKSGKAPDTLLKLGMSLAAMGQASDACVAFGELEVRYPGASDTVKQRLATERSKNGC